ncbi:MAG: DNA topoisomerase IV subunit A [Zoogloeaceae bacterium]|jgi:topoisomerase-4 subunit A|nr:DNA topoisomerase IV subunit A [Zoogloeaceae bacterium]
MIDDTPDLFAGTPTAGDSVPNSLSLDDDGNEQVLLHESAARDYLEYAVAVVKGRALPDTRDGMKPVQRRVLYAMRELGLSAAAKPVKSARVVGDVIGKYHPHGDASAYDAMVRVAQPFTLRYPLVDGQGNFGSRDGDSAAAMRYTEARLTPIAELLLAELDMGTVDFQPNYDGAFEEPVYLPARLPFSLLNGASGIAVGMATEIPPHNLTEVAAAARHLLAHPDAVTEDLLAHVRGPDYPGGGQIISAAEEIALLYRVGRGSLRARGRYRIEELARGAWQVVFTELPPGVSAAKVLAEIGAILSPPPRNGKKTGEQAAAQLKGLFASQLERARDESGKEDDVRLVFEPVSSRQNREDFVALLLAHTSLEISVPVNLVAVGLDGRPCQKSLLELLSEWLAFRVETVTRRSKFALEKARDRIHILEGRHLVFLNLDAVISLIRESDEPKAALMRRFQLSERQADDILEIRLRQLARLEGIRLEQELERLRADAQALEHLLADESLLKQKVGEEISADAAKYGDSRRTLIEPALMASRAEVATVTDEPVTVIVSQKGWVRARQGHHLDLSSLAFKEGDAQGSVSECRTIDTLGILTDDGRSYSVPVAQLPDGRGMGAPLTSLIDAKQARIVHALAGKPETRLLIAKTSGYGFVTTLADLFSRQRAGKSFLSMEADARILPLQPLPAETGKPAYLAALSSGGRLLIFPLAQMKEGSGGKGVRILALKEGETLVETLITPYPAVLLRGLWRGRLKEIPSEAVHLGQRARRGASVAPLKEIALKLPSAPPAAVAPAPEERELPME